MVSTDEIQSAGLIRRALSIAIDMLAGVAVVTAGYLVGLLDPAPLAPPPDWFWTEWWLKHWLDDPGIFVRPLGAFVFTSVTWTVVWETVSGRTPGDRLAGLEVIGPGGDRPGPVRIAARACGIALNITTLGLGWLWVLVSPERRGLHEIVSSTRTILRRN